MFMKTTGGYPMKFRKILSTVTVAALAALPFGRVTAAPDEVVIGVIYPLSGPVAQAGIDAVAAINTALEIINGESDLNVPLAKSKGLPNLGGAKIRIVVADQNPGVTNWVETLGHRRGFLQFRWQRVSRALTEADGPTVELIDFDAIPATLPHYQHNKISEDDWRARIALRQQQIAVRMLG